MNISYVESVSKKVQGSLSEVKRRYPGYYIEPLGKGGGNWLVTKPADIVIDGKSYRRYVLDHYNKDRLNIGLFNLFKSEIELGLISL